MFPFPPINLRFQRLKLGRGNIIPVAKISDFWFSLNCDISVMGYNSGSASAKVCSRPIAEPSLDALDAVQALVTNTFHIYLLYFPINWETRNVNKKCIGFNTLGFFKLLFNYFYRKENIFFCLEACLYGSWLMPFVFSPAYLLGEKSRNKKLKWRGAERNRLMSGARAGFYLLSVGTRLCF
jgi:hypothetical protein